MSKITLETVSPNIYRNDYGYFILDANSEWVFIPIETEFTVDLLMSITDTLRNLNENSTSS